MILRKHNFNFSEYFYAIDLNSLKPTYANRAEMKAVWFKKTRGQLAVCIGTLSSSGKTVEEFFANHDGRYGGNTEYKWNGKEMWSSNNYFLELVAAHKILDPMLTSFPNVPTGYEGWFSIKG
jgi:hypothetical protein